MAIDPGTVQVDQSSKTIDLRGTGAREDLMKVLREHGIDPDKKGQQIDASTMPGLQEAIFEILGAAGLQIPGTSGDPGTTIATGPGGMRATTSIDPLEQVEHLARKRDAGEITDAEFEAQKRKLLG